MDFDSALHEVNDFGPYQIALFFLICLPATLPSAFSTYNQPFVVGEPPHRCNLPSGRGYLKLMGEVTSQKLQCMHYNETTINLMRDLNGEYYNITEKEVGLIPCQYGWIYDNSTYINSLVTEFDLVCDQKYWIDMTTTAFYLGSFIGNSLFGHIADKFGRRTSFFMIICTLLIFGTATAFSPNVQSFIVLRFFAGLAFPALFQIPFIISMEFMGESGRLFSCLMIDVFFGLSLTLLGGVAMLIRQWRLLIFVCNAPFVLLLSYYFFLPESPRWLASVGRYAEVKSLMLKIARFNKRKHVDVDELIEKMKEHDCHKNEGRKYTMYDLFKTPNLRRKTILLTYIWLINATVYNCMTLNVSNLPVDDHLSFIINGVVEIPAYFIVWPMLNCIGRRWTLASSMLLAGLACISTIFISPTSDYTWVIAVLAYIGKFGIAGSFAVIYIFAGELYPTVVRAIGMGMSSMFAGCGLILAPKIVRLGDYLRILPLILMGTSSLSAGIASLLLPETNGSALPQTLSEAEIFGQKLLSDNDDILKQNRRSSCKYFDNQGIKKQCDVQEMRQFLNKDNVDSDSTHI